MTLICRRCLLVLFLFAGAPAVAGDIANEIEARTEALRAEGLPEQRAQRIASLEDAIQKGEAASGSLRRQIEVLQQQTQTLEEQKDSLERVQVVLASGLIGALVTAAVALFGAFSGIRRSRAERDLRRLEVIEKAYQLNQQGVPLPEEFSLWLPEQR